MKDKQISIRLTTEQDNRLKEKADRQGMGKSEYLRYLILKDLEAEKVKS